ncbi:MAG: hypothetical protein ACYS8Z_03760, partial [Planctomycetota bacterium]
MFFRLLEYVVGNRTASIALFAVLLLCSGIHVSCSYGQTDVNSADWCDESLAKVVRGFPSAVVEKAKTSMPGYIYKAWEWKEDWLSKRVFTFENDNWGKQWVFLQTKTGCAETSCPSGIPFINEVLAEYPFARADATNDAEAHAFLNLIRKLYSRDLGIVGSQEFLRIQEKSSNLPRWLKGKEQNEAVLRKLFRRPTFNFEGKLWKVSFNAFNIDGSVDEWSVTGTCGKRERCNRVLDIDIERLKKKGTFSFPWTDWARKYPNDHWEPIIARQPKNAVAKAKEALEGRLDQVWEWDYHRKWMSNKILYFSDEYGFEAIFLEVDGDYLQLNCPSGIIPINLICRRYSFEKQDFADPVEVQRFLRRIVAYYRGPGRIVGSSIFLEEHASGEYLDDWLMGSEPSEEVFKSLCKDPQFV